jgi:hypothetical protein
MTSEKVHIDSFWRSLNKHTEELCGDRVMEKHNAECYVMVLADGLGSGVKANILSTLTSTIISEMIFRGMPLKDAVETIAATLPTCKERGVAYSTFTIIQIFYDGHVYMAQFDNPTCVIIRDGKLFQPEQEVVTVSGRNVHVSNFTTQPYDDIITFSDGVLHAGVGMTLNFGWGQKDVEQFLLQETRPHDSAREISRILLANVNYLYGGEPGDDSTVAAICIVPAKETRIMVGPPSDKNRDEEVVKKLLSATGMKICCGGTTSEIVARYLHEEIRTDGTLSSAVDVPPKGFIKGIDLVTEGVLTLQKVNRYLNKAKDDPMYLENLLSSKEEDGASCLVRALLKSTGIRFMVGLSDNPAHDAIAYSPISLNAKIALINELSENLQAVGKIVHIDMD